MKSGMPAWWSRCIALAASVLILAAPRSAWAVDAEALPVWAVYHGGTGDALEVVFDVAASPSGAAYICGEDHGDPSALPQWTNTKPGPFGDPCVFVAKVSADGSLEWLTWIGSQIGECSVAADASGNCYVSGEAMTARFTGGGVPTGEGWFVAKFNAAGARQWIQFLSTPGCGRPTAIAVDGSGNAVVSAVCYGGTLANPVDATKPPGLNLAAGKISPAGAVLWTAYIGGKGDDRADRSSVAADSSGNVYVGGKINWSGRGAETVYDMPGLLNNPWKGGNEDGVVVKLNAGGQIQWSRLVGGELDDQVRALAVDASGIVYAGGNTISETLDPPSVTGGAGGWWSSFYARLNADGTPGWLNIPKYGGIPISLALDVLLMPDHFGIVGVSEICIYAFDPVSGASTYAKARESIFRAADWAVNLRGAATASPWDFFMAGATLRQLSHPTNAPWTQNALLTRVHFEPCADAYEPNDTMAQARDLRAHKGQWLGDLPSGLPRVADLDWYIVEVLPGAPELRIEARNPSPMADLHLALHQTNGTHVTWDGNNAEGDTALVVPGPAAGVYLVCVSVFPQPPNGGNPTRPTSYDLRWNDGVSTATTRIIRLTGDLAFGPVTVGASSNRPFTIHNDGNAPLTVAQITWPADFSGSWSGMIPAGGSQPAQAVFAPTAAGERGGVLTVVSDATGGQATRSVSGTGVAAGGLWSQAIPLGNNWYWSSWFGYFILVEGGWLYHNDWGWIYCSGQSSGSVWMWNSWLGWFWTSDRDYPWFYSVNEGSWMWYQLGSWDGTRGWFIHLNQGVWVRLPP